MNCLSVYPFSPNKCAVRAVESTGGSTGVTENFPAHASIPVQSPAGLILDHTGLEEVLFFLEIDHLRHPRERLVAPGNSGSRPICCARRLAKKRRYSLNIGAFRPRTPRGHSVLGVAYSSFHAPLDQAADFLRGLRGPQVWILHLDLVESGRCELQCMDSSRRMYWYCSAAPRSLVLAPQRQDLGQSRRRRNNPSMMQANTIKLFRSCWSAAGCRS